MDDKELRITAALAHLNISDKEIKKFAEEVSLMLDYFSIVDKVNVSDYEAESYLQHDNELRPDTVEDKSNPKLVENADENEDGYIILPNIL